MCLAIPGKVIEINGEELSVEYPGQTRKAMRGGVDVNIGDYVMVQMGIVIKVLAPEEAELAKSAWKNI